MVTSNQSAQHPLKVPDPNLFESSGGNTDQADVVLESFAGPARESGYAADPEFRLRGGFINPMVDAAMPLLGLGMRLSTLTSHHDIEQLYKDVHLQLTVVLEEIRQLKYEPALFQAYSYSLCLYLDETVMGTPWGRDSIWSQHSLLSEFHQETWGGEKFFTVMSRMMQEPARFQQGLEFMYICVCIGLKGKYAIEPKGDEAVQKIIVELHRLIRELRGPTPELFGDPLANVAPHNLRVKREWPWWSPLVISAAALAALYGYYTYRLQSITAEVVESLSRILQ